MSTQHYSVTENDELTDILITNICAQLSMHNWSLKMLADSSELPYESIKKLINRKISRPSFYSIWKIASAFGCSVDQLAGRENPANATLQQISENASEIFRLLADFDTNTNPPNIPDCQLFASHAKLHRQRRFYLNIEEIYAKI